MQFPVRKSESMSIETPTASVRPSLVVSTAPSSPPPTRRDSNSIRSVTTTEGPPLTEEEIEKKPWKYIGYKGYSEFLASENDFFIFRKFASLNSRIALRLQDQLSVLNGELEELDIRYSRKDAADVNNGSFRYDQVDRSELLERIQDKLVKYS